MDRGHEAVRPAEQTPTLYQSDIVQYSGIARCSGTAAGSSAPRTPPLTSFLKAFLEGTAVDGMSTWLGVVKQAQG